LWTSGKEEEEKRIGLDIHREEMMTALLTEHHKRHDRDASKKDSNRRTHGKDIWRRYANNGLQVHSWSKMKIEDDSMKQRCIRRVGWDL